MTSPVRGDDPNRPSPLKQWEQKVIFAVGSVISFWGFKENHGRIWALLYLRHSPHRSTDIQQILGLSKGSVSMLLSDLESWNIILLQKKKKPKLYIANDKLLEMIVQVFQQREKGLLLKTQTILKDALKDAQKDEASIEVITRISLMLKLTQLIARLLSTMEKLSSLTISALLNRFLNHDQR